MGPVRHQCHCYVMCNTNRQYLILASRCENDYLNFSFYTMQLETNLKQTRKEAGAVLLIHTITAKLIHHSCLINSKGLKSHRSSVYMCMSGTGPMSPTSKPAPKPDGHSHSSRTGGRPANMHIQPHFHVMAVDECIIMAQNSRNSSFLTITLNILFVYSFNLCIVRMSSSRCSIVS